MKITTTRKSARTAFCVFAVLALGNFARATQYDATLSFWATDFIASGTNAVPQALVSGSLSGSFDDTTLTFLSFTSIDLNINGYRYGIDDVDSYRYSQLNYVGGSLNTLSNLYQGTDDFFLITLCDSFGNLKQAPNGYLGSRFVYTTSGVNDLWYTNQVFGSIQPTAPPPSVPDTTNVFGLMVVSLVGLIALRRRLTK